MARQSFYDHGYSGHVFVRDYDVDLKDLHLMCHDFLDEKIIAKSQEIQGLFSALALDHVLVTHSHRVWAQRVLNHIGLSAWFDGDCIFGLEDYDYRHKHECRSSFEKALEKLSCTPAAAIMVEDTLKNLRIPRDMGMLTVFIHHGRPPQVLPDFVDFSCAGTADFLKILADAQRTL
jgi:putative hydrolase of the HAD superfamily